jgi:SNF2 family DNA or RNA helicase
MSTATAAKPQPIRTLADFWAAANLEGPAWASQVALRHLPFQHQITGLNHLALSPRSGLYDDAGLGKTLQAQAHTLWLVGLGNRALCVMPPVLVPQFYRNFSVNFPGIEQYVSIALFQGDLSQRNALIEQWDREGWPQILVMSNALFAGKSKRSLEALQRKRAQSAQKKGEACPPLSPADQMGPDGWLQRGYNHLLHDESTAVKSPSSDLHQAVKRFVGPDGPETNGLVLMTGTPIDNSPEDAYGLIALLSPDRYSSRRAFESVHIQWDLYSKYPKVVRYLNLDYLWQSLYLKGRRVTKQEVLDLPPRLISELQVELSPTHRDLYKKLCQERVLELGERVIDATAASSLYVKCQRMLICPESFHEGRFAAENTLLTTLDELLDTLGKQKVVIFCWFTESILKLAQRYTQWSPALLYGGVNGAEREKQKARFLQDPKCRIMLMNPRSGGVGLDGLQAVCSHVIFAEGVTTPGLFEQAVSRLHRSGQHSETVNIYLLTALGTVAVRRRNDLLRKEGEANAVVRDAKGLLNDLLGADGVQGVLS